MRESEQRFFAAGESSLALMERAAKALADELTALMPEGGTCAFACGKGGNGGDGYAAARLLAKRGVRCVVVECGLPKHADALTNRELAKDAVFALTDSRCLDTLPCPAVWADCVFGTGLKSAPEGEFAKLIRRMNADRARGTRVVSCDIPSGLSSDTGEILGECVRADVTVTFQYLKRGHLLGRGPDVCGDVRVRDIGLPDAVLPNDYMRLIEDADALSALPARPRTAHKNDFGHLLVFAGSRGMAGAAVLCVRAALRMGVGLVTAACPASITDIVQISAPSAMCVPLAEENGHVSDAALDTLLSALKGKTAIAAGPGLSRGASVKCLKAVLESALPAVLDADALNIISARAELKQLLSARHALTPHPGECARLTGQTGLDSVTYTQKISRLGANVLVKGASSVIEGEGLFVSASGCVGMAKGGSGDVLTGMTGALLAQGVEPETALWTASQLHGRAGELAQSMHGAVSMLPQDIIECIGRAINDADA